MNSLYELTGQFLEIQSILESGEYDDQIVKDTLESLEFEIEEKADNYAKIIRNFESQIDAIKAEEKRLKDRRGTFEKSVKQLKENLQAAMIETGKRKFKTDLFSFNIAKNGGALPVVVDVETWALPDELVKIEEKPNLKAIETLLKENPERGAKYAHFGERGESIRIK